MALAAILGQVGEKSRHRVEAGRVNHRTALATNGDKAGVTQAIKVERERVRRETKRIGDCTARHSIRTRFLQPKNVEPVLLGKSSQGRDGRYLFLYFNECRN
jgi:hypothetical protein